jgi:Ca2+-binding EF-hand superfamily protein
VRETFDYIDRDKSGSIDASELGLLLGELAWGGRG